jgi:hypothetical protein
MPAAISGWMRASRRKLPAASPGREKSFPPLLKNGTRNDGDLPKCSDRMMLEESA